MRIGIIGAGFTGLTAGLRLAQIGHEVFLIEKEDSVGGLAVGFKEKEWKWSLEKAYHHWFTNDSHALKLARELHHPVVTKRPSTDVYISHKPTPFDSPLTLLTFPYLPLLDRLRTGLGALYLKMLNDYKILEGKKAYPWLKKWMGRKSFELIWDPLFTGKFGEYKEDIALTWFWARIKKRTSSLAYPKYGFQAFAQNIAQEIKHRGGNIYLNKTVVRIHRGKKLSIEMESGPAVEKLDKIIVTLPSPLFIKTVASLPSRYTKRVTSIEHLHALNLILLLKKPFMKKTYWLNITDKDFPFLVLAEHTNFMDRKDYGGNHILYIGNYLPREHPYFKMNKHELLKEFDPYLKQINPTYNVSLITYYLFVGPFAQPIVTTDYSKRIPTFNTPIPNIFLANLDMVYPWDRGTNYAIELGENVAKHIDS